MQRQDKLNLFRNQFCKASPSEVFHKDTYNLGFSPIINRSSCNYTT